MKKTILLLFLRTIQTRDIFTHWKWNRVQESKNILDALHIYNIEEVPASQKKGTIRIIWSKDWQRCALIINNYCHAVFDFKNHGGYCRNEFPPPNSIWTKGDRKLTNEMVAAFFK